VTESVTNDVSSPHPSPNPTDHARHDHLLVTRYAAADAYAGEVEQARALVESCAECAALAADIRLLSTATARLPAPRRRRDFRLAPEQAEALRGSFLERLLRRLAAPGLAPLRPVAGVALSLGILLAVVGAGLPMGMGAAPAMLPEQEFAPMIDDGGTPAAPADPAFPHAAGAPDAAGTPGADAMGAGEPREGAAQVEDDPAAREDPGRLSDPDSQDLRISLAQPDAAETTRALLVYGGAAIALVSLGVLLLVWFARRRTNDPLLR
jgi:hypothetical protein